MPLLYLAGKIRHLHYIIMRIFQIYTARISALSHSYSHIIIGMTVSNITARRFADHIHPIPYIAIPDAVYSLARTKSVRIISIACRYSFRVHLHKPITGIICIILYCSISLFRYKIAVQIICVRSCPRITVLRTGIRCNTVISVICICFGIAFRSGNSNWRTVSSRVVGVRVNS